MKDLFLLLNLTLIHQKKSPVSPVLNDAEKTAVSHLENNVDSEKYARVRGKDRSGEKK